MNADEYMKNIRKSNPKLFDVGRIIISPLVLEEQIRRAFAYGRREARDELCSESGFGRMFGGGFRQ